MKLSQRLLTIASFIKDDAFVMDVGADHGLLEKYLLDNNKVKGLIAVENKVGPYSILKNALDGYDVTLLLSDGISDIDDRVDTLVIAGMGGNLILNILQKDASKLHNVKNIVVDAHRDASLVREGVSELGYKIRSEKIVYENKKYYFVMLFEKGHREYSKSELEIGVGLLSDPLFEQYKHDQISKINTEIEKCRLANHIDEKKIALLNEKIERLNHYGNH